MKWLGLTCLTIASKDRTASLFSLLCLTCVLTAKGEPTPKFNKTGEKETNYRIWALFWPIFWSLLSTSDCQSEVGEVFGKIGGELPA